MTVECTNCKKLLDVSAWAAQMKVAKESGVSPIGIIACAFCAQVHKFQIDKYGAYIWEAAKK